MVEGLVTVVVPVYKVEKYLDRCVSSIVNQTYTNLEIILVDDGSPDRCPQMCEEWAKRDSRIKVVHKENAGLGMARNTGIENATGEYICFFDSDDYIEPETIAECYYEAKNEAADIVSFGNDKILENGTVVWERIPSPPQYTFSGREIKERLLPMVLSHNVRTGENWNLSLSACFSMFSISVIRQNRWRFVSEREIISEDYYSVLKYYNYVNKVVILDKIFYHYTTNPTSLTQTYRKDRYTKIRYFYTRLLMLGEELECSDILDDGMTAIFLGLTMGCMKQLVASCEPISDKITALKAIIEDQVLQNTVRSRDFSGENIFRNLFYWTIRNRCVYMCYFVVWLRNTKG